MRPNSALVAGMRSLLASLRHGSLSRFAAVL